VSYAERATVVPPDGSARSFRTADSVTQFIRDLKR